MGFLAASTFDPSSKHANITLSGSNLIATIVSGTGSVRSTNRCPGLSYFEMVLGATLTTAARVGLSNQATNFATSQLLGADATAIGYDNGGTVKINNITITTLATFTASDNIGVAYDFIRQLVWFRKNGGNWNNDVIGNQNPVGAVGGISVSSLNGTLSPAWSGTATSSATAKFASASWTYSAPTGFTTVDTLVAVGFQGTRPDFGKSFTTPTRSVGNFGHAVGYAVPATKTISGQVKELGVAIAGKRVALYDPLSLQLVGSCLSDASGNFSISTRGRLNVIAVAQDPVYRAIVYDQLTPV